MFIRTAASLNSLSYLKNIAKTTRILVYIFAQHLAKFYPKLIGGESTFVTFSAPDFVQATGLPF
jgi:hypothetical protein